MHASDPEPTLELILCYVKKRRAWREEASILQKHFLHDTSDNLLIGCEGIERENAFLHLPPEQRRGIGNPAPEGGLFVGVVQSWGCLTNDRALIVEDREDGMLSCPKRSAASHLRGTGELLEAVRGCKSHSFRGHIGHFPDAPVGVEFQATERNLDRRMVQSGIRDQHHCLRIVRPT